MLGNKEKLIIKILIGVFLTIGITFGVIVMIYIFQKDQPVPYWINHFGFAIILFSISPIAFMLPMLNQSKYVGDGKGDSLMLIVSILLFLCGLLSIGISYLVK